MGLSTASDCVLAGADVAWVLFARKPLGYQLTLGYQLGCGSGAAFTTLAGGSMFYGLTWLGEEFKAQPEGQFVGTLQVKLRF